MKTALAARFGLVSSLWLASTFLQSLPYDWPARQVVSCNNNLRQIAKALRMWAMDNEDQYPFSLSTNRGGTLEYCARDSQGVDSNAFLHFIVASNELAVPLALVCPHDRSEHPAPSFAQLQPQNVSYRLYTATNVRATVFQQVLAVCPVHGTALQCDGSLLNAPPDAAPVWASFWEMLALDGELRFAFLRMAGVLVTGLVFLMLAFLFRRASVAARH